MELKKGQVIKVDSTKVFEDNKLVLKGEFKIVDDTILKKLGFVGCKKIEDGKEISNHNGVNRLFWIMEGMICEVVS